MQTPGIIGGIAPESTIQYYRLIIAAYRQRKADGSYPSILINSIDMTTMLGLIAGNDRVGVIGYLAGEIEKLQRAGADFCLLASNTPHIVFDALQARVPIPLISIVEATSAAVQARGVKRVGLFGTAFTMQGGFYQEVLAHAGIGVVVPDPDDQAYIHEKYMTELVNAVFLPETRRRLLAIAEGLHRRHAIEGLILGGTELPLILNDTGGLDMPFFDTTRIHAESAAARMLL
jgi:aspartate racemase